MPMSNILVIRLHLIAAAIKPRTSWISKNHIGVFEREENLLHYGISNFALKLSQLSGIALES